MVNYFEWSMEYKNTADSIQDVIDGNQQKRT